MTKFLRFCYMLGVYVAPNLLVASVFIVLLESGPIDDTFEQHGVFWALTVGVFLAPMFETLLLLWSTSLVEKYMGSSSRWVLSIAGALPLIVMHGFISYQKIFVVAWGFIWLAYCSFELRASGSWSAAFWTLCGIHSIVNAGAILSIYQFD